MAVAGWNGDAATASWQLVTCTQCSSNAPLVPHDACGVFFELDPQKSQLAV